MLNHCQRYKTTPQLAGWQSFSEKIGLIFVASVPEFQIQPPCDLDTCKAKAGDESEPDEHLTISEF